MGTQFPSPMAGKWFVSAIALSAAVLVGIAATPAWAQVETVIAQASPTSQSPLVAVDIPGTKPPVSFIAFFGNEYGDCGSLIKTTKKDGLWGYTIVDTFAAGSSGHGCNPISISLTNGGATVVVVTQQGGAYEGGTLNTYDGATGSLVSTESFDNGISLVGATVAEFGNAPSIWRRAGGTSNTYAIITNNNAIFAAEVASNGALSAPQEIFSFPGDGKGGAFPFGPAVMGPDGNLYGTTNQGGKRFGNGVVYELSPVISGNKTTWTETVLHTFTGGADGGKPAATVAFDSDGNVYGTTTQGGMIDGALTGCSAGGFVGPTNAGCGVVFELIKGSTAPWKERVLYSFSGGGDGAEPEAPVVLDARNNIYGTTFAGGNIHLAACSGAAISGATPGCGVVFKLARGSRAETVLYAFMDGTDGAEPAGPVDLGGANIYGTAVAGGNPGCAGGASLGYANGCGVVFEITP